MNTAILSVALTALTMTAAGIGWMLRYSSRIQQNTTDVYYIRRDLDQLLRLYRLTSVAEQERRRRH